MKKNPIVYVFVTSILKISLLTLWVALLQGYCTMPFSDPKCKSVKIVNLFCRLRGYGVFYQGEKLPKSTQILLFFPFSELNLQFPFYLYLSRHHKS